MVGTCATLATKRTLLLTWAGLPPAGSHQLCLAHSLDHLVGAREQRPRYGEAERLCRLQVDQELILRWILHRQIARFLAPEDAVHTTGHSSKLIDVIRPVGDQATIDDEKAKRVDRGQTVAGRQSDYQLAINLRQPVR